jgi:hypothetical protein
VKLLPASFYDLPPQPTEIHRSPCSHCPSAHYPSDPESDDIRACDRETRAKHAFRCAWRPEKLCRGYCDDMGLDESDFAAASQPGAV